MWVCLFLTIHVFTQPEPLWFKKISIDEGLASTYVSCIIQDRKGFMWFGTWKGLSRWDGYQFKTFRHDPTDTLSAIPQFRLIVEDTTRSAPIVVVVYVSNGKFIVRSSLNPGTVMPFGGRDEIPRMFRPRTTFLPH